MVTPGEVGRGTVTLTNGRAMSKKPYFTESVGQRHSLGVHPDVSCALSPTRYRNRVQLPALPQVIGGHARPEPMRCDVFDHCVSVCFAKWQCRLTAVRRAATVVCRDESSRRYVWG